MTERLNYAYLIGMALTGAIGFLLIGYWCVYFNVFMLITHRQYIYYNKYVIQSEDLFNSIVNGTILFGATFGALLVGPFLKYGRRNVMIWLSVIMIWFTLITLIFNFFALVIGRFGMGLWAGAYGTLCPIILAEISPPQISSTIGTFNQFLSVIGILIGYLWVKKEIDL